ncbi:FecR family protein [Mucilaginibacter defluvii]|uniref:DUF4974 domain-containing protein n=1 Tax=Mucilaginibacter defluvii TaxID=1196019 RepID=A0ABP9FWB7_9SPHI
MEEKQSPEELIRRYVAGEATAKEKAWVESWYLNELEKCQYYPTEETINNKSAEIRATILSRTAKQRTVNIWPRIAAAAAILFFICAGGYLFFNKTNFRSVHVAQVKPDISPGDQSAILLLSDGRKINLHDAKTGNIASEGKTKIIKTADNQIIYKADAPASSTQYNVVVTRAGNFYPLKLADGTVAILDAGSSIKYPVNFTGRQRRVEITGQVYFEVKHNAAMPFRVSVKGNVIEDLGTSFNINAYDDEPNIKATLIEGSMRVNDQVTLTPGKQATINKGRIKVSKTDIEQVIAWKNGLFKFNTTPIDQGMRQLSRWYNVTVEYPNGIPDVTFNGEIHRSTNASQVLEILSFSKVKFQIVNTPYGKKIIVKP